MQSISQAAEQQRQQQWQAAAAPPRSSSRQAGSQAPEATWREDARLPAPLPPKASAVTAAGDTPATSAGRLFRSTRSHTSTRPSPRTSSTTPGRVGLHTPPV